jgi:hypothetical protein
LCREHEFFFRESYQLESVKDFVADLGIVHALHFKAESDIFEDAAIGKDLEILEYYPDSLTVYMAVTERSSGEIYPIDDNASGRWPDLVEQKLEDCCFSRAGLADKEYELVIADFEGDVAESGIAEGKRYGYVIEIDHEGLRGGIVISARYIRHP